MMRKMGQYVDESLQSYRIIIGIKICIKNTKGFCLQL